MNDELDLKDGAIVNSVTSTHAVSAAQRVQHVTPLTFVPSSAVTSSIGRIIAQSQHDLLRSCNAITPPNKHVLNAVTIGGQRNSLPSITPFDDIATTSFATAIQGQSQQQYLQAQSSTLQCPIGSPLTEDGLHYSHLHPTSAVAHIQHAHPAALGGVSNSYSQPDLRPLGGHSSDCARMLAISNCMDAADAVNARVVAQLSEENRNLRKELDAYMKKALKLQQLELNYQRVEREYDELARRQERQEQLQNQVQQRMQLEMVRLRNKSQQLREQLDFSLVEGGQREHDMQLKQDLSNCNGMIAELITQNKELMASKQRQQIDMEVQQATLDEQRSHIQILDQAIDQLNHKLKVTQLQLNAKSDIEKQCIELQRTVEQLREENDRARQKQLTTRTATVSPPHQFQFGVSRLKEVNRLQTELERREALTHSPIFDEERRLSIGRSRSEERRLTELQAKVDVLESRLAEKDAMIKVLKRYATHSANESSWPLLDSQRLSKTRCRLEAVKQRLVQSSCSPQLHRHSYSLATSPALQAKLHSFDESRNNFGLLPNRGSVGGIEHWRMRSSDNARQSRLSLGYLSLPNHVLSATKESYSHLPTKITDDKKNDDAKAKTLCDNNNADCGDLKIVNDNTVLSSTAGLKISEPSDRRHFAEKCVVEPTADSSLIRCDDDDTLDNEVLNF